MPQVDQHYLVVCSGLTGEILRGLSSLPSAEAACAALTTILSNVAGNVSDDGWKDTVKAAAVPCGQEGCNCEVRRTALLDALTLLRDDYKAKEKEGTEKVFVPFAQPPPKPSKPSLN